MLTVKQTSLCTFGNPLHYLISFVSFAALRDLHGERNYWAPQKNSSKMLGKKQCGDCEHTRVDGKTTPTRLCDVALRALSHLSEGFHHHTTTQILRQPQQNNNNNPIGYL